MRVILVRENIDLNLPLFLNQNNILKKVEPFKKLLAFILK